MSRRWAVVLGVAIVILIGIATALFDLSRAAAELNDSRDALNALSTDARALRTKEGRRAALEQTQLARTQLDRASRRLRGSISLKIVGALPVVDRQRDGALQLVDDVRHSTRDLEALLKVLDEVADDIAIVDGRLQLDVIERLVAPTTARRDNPAPGDTITQGPRAAVGQRAAGVQ